MRKHLSIVIVLALLLSFAVTALHNHEDGADHSDCPICVISHHQSGDCPPPAAFKFVQTVTRGSYLLMSSSAPASSPYTPANNRAPPA